MMTVIPPYAIGLAGVRRPYANETLSVDVFGPCGQLIFQVVLGTETGSSGAFASSVPLPLDAYQVRLTGHGAIVYDFGNASPGCQCGREFAVGGVDSSKASAQIKCQCGVAHEVPTDALRQWRLLA